MIPLFHPHVDGPLTMLFTKNGAPATNGTTFAAQRSPTHRDLYGIGCTGPATCYAVGEDGTILARR